MKSNCQSGDVNTLKLCSGVEPQVGNGAHWHVHVVGVTSRYRDTHGVPIPVYTRDGKRLQLDIIGL